MKKIILGTLVLSLFCGACEEFKPASDDVSVEEVLAVNEVKRISVGVEQGWTPNDWSQLAYVVSADQRLLLRSSQLRDRVSSIVVGPTKPAYLDLRLADANADVAQWNTAAHSLRVCPLQVNWMMLATWTRAHPYNSTGVWQRPGGDYSDTDCVKADVAEAVVGVNPRRLRFLLTDWFAVKLIGQNQDYGFVVVVTGESVELSGEADISRGPRFSVLMR